MTIHIRFKKTQKLIKTVKKNLHPKRLIRQLAKGNKVPKTTMCRLGEDDLKLYQYKFKKLISDHTKKTCLALNETQEWHTSKGMACCNEILLIFPLNFVCLNHNFSSSFKLQISLTLLNTFFLLAFLLLFHYNNFSPCNLAVLPICFLFYLLK